MFFRGAHMILIIMSFLPKRECLNNINQATNSNAIVTLNYVIASRRESSL